MESRAAYTMDCNNKSALEESLVAEGWIVQFSVSGSRLQEAIETYSQLGFEVKTVPFTEINCGGCTLCFENEAEPTMTILTRRTPNRSAKNTEKSAD